MSEKSSTPKSRITPDWLVQGILTKIGDMFDRLTGRSWRPSSSLATSELIEKLKQLIDSEVRESDGKRRFVPHNIKLKMQWDKFSTDSEDSLRRLEAELLTAVVDHINDKRYYTYAPLILEVKQDYFTSGVKLFVSFDKVDEQGREAEVDVSIPVIRAADQLPGESGNQISGGAEVIFSFDESGRPVRKRLILEGGKRLSVGRSKENDLAINDPSVSKMHASILINAEQQLVIADTGSTNGTFVDGERIPYGKAVTLLEGGKLKTGTVEIGFELTRKPVEVIDEPEPAKTEVYSVGDMHFTSKTEEILPPEQSVPAKTEASVPMPKFDSGTVDAAPLPAEQYGKLDLSVDDEAIHK